MREKRKSKRHQVVFPIIVESQNRYYHVSRTRNVAVSGVQVKMDALLKIGEPVNITYDIHRIKNQNYDAQGKVVRVEPNGGTDRDKWPFLTSVQFAQSYSQLATYIMRTAPKDKWLT